LLEFQLFRLQVYPSQQMNFFKEQKNRTTILIETIKSFPQAEFKEGMIWHIGNIISIEDGALYFRIGRTTKSTIEVYKDGNFLDQEFETAPYTHVFLDAKIEVCAIAKKAKLAPRVMGISNRFVKLLNKSKKALELETEFKISELSDPKDFISYLESAYNISKFTFSFTRPNAWDVNQDIVKPLQKFAAAVDGKSGKTEIEGENLNAGILEEISRSVASTGDDASALLQIEETDKTSRKRLKGNPVLISQADVLNDKEKKEFLNKLRKIYNKIRGKEQTN
jgi:hypothetical protein